MLKVRLFGKTKKKKSKTKAKKTFSQILSKKHVHCVILFAIYFLTHFYISNESGIKIFLKLSITKYPKDTC